MSVQSSMLGCDLHYNIGCYESTFANVCPTFRGGDALISKFDALSWMYAPGPGVQEFKEGPRGPV